MNKLAAYELLLEDHPLWTKEGETLILPVWGGRKKDYGQGPVQARVGYSNIIGIVPFPDVGVRLGDRKKMGLTLTTAGIGGSVAKDSFKDRSTLKGLPDLAVNAIEDAVKKRKATKGKKK